MIQDTRDNKIKEHHKIEDNKHVNKSKLEDQRSAEYKESANNKTQCPNISNISPSRSYKNHEEAKWLAN